MSKPKHYWYPYVLKRIKMYNHLREEDTEQANRYADAIDEVLKRTKEKEYGDLRCEALRMLYFNHTHTIDGVALELHFSPRMIQSWASQFVNEVGKEAGD